MSLIFPLYFSSFSCLAWWLRWYSAGLHLLDIALVRLSFHCTFSLFSFHVPGQEMHFSIPEPAYFEAARRAAATNVESLEAMQMQQTARS
jgi:hypothetical protein